MNRISRLASKLGHYFIVSLSILFLAGCSSPDQESAKIKLSASPASFRCEVLSKEMELEPAVSIEKAERQSLKEQAEDTPPDEPDVPKVPFDDTYVQWVSLKDNMMPGDTLHRFNGQGHGGYLVMRGNCVVGKMTEWME